MMRFSISPARLSAALVAIIVVPLSTGLGVPYPVNPDSSLSGSAPNNDIMPPAIPPPAIPPPPIPPPPIPIPPPPAPPADPTLAVGGDADQRPVIKMLVCGDSISQGLEGDFTWRYRLWEWFRENTKAHGPLTTSSSSTDLSVTIYPRLQFVGPYNGTLPAVIKPIDLDASSPQTWGSYHPSVDPLFWPGGGSSHFAVYGRPAWMDVDLIGAQVAAYRPDFVLLHLGFNDLGWWDNKAADLVGSIQRLVFNARLAKSDVRVLIADVSHRDAVVGREDIPPVTDEYNRLLGLKAAEWTTVTSPIEVVRVSEDYDCHVKACPAGIDGLHPNALGDFQIARAYTRVLHDKFRFGSAPLVVPKKIPGIVDTALTSPTMGAIASPPVGIFAGVALLCLVLVWAFRPEWLRRRRFAKVRYHMLPSR